jgi:nucleoside-diphosphate-sugar epimerase
MSKVLVTGATGFVGRPLVDILIDANCDIIALVRERSLSLPEQVIQVPVGDLIAWSDMNTSIKSKIKKLLSDVDVVIHLAARVHVMADNSNDPLAGFREVNTYGTLNLAEQAAAVGVKRFIFISSIKVNGESTELCVPFRPDDTCMPEESYGLSKHEAEVGLRIIANKTGMEVIIIRPPLVYGPNVKANFTSMMKWLNKGVPLPFGAIYNKRSLVALDNLVSFIMHCIDHPKAANEVFLISDGEDVSTTQLLQKVARVLGKKPSLIPVPVIWMTFTARFVGKGDVATRLFGSLYVDSSKARDLLGWEPVITMDEQLKKTADAYLKNEKTL